MSIAWQTEAPKGRYHMNPKMNTTDLGSGLTLSEQRLLSDNGYASAVQRVANADGSCTIFQSTMGRLPGDASAVAAQAAVAAASTAGLTALRQSHQQWWHDYYPASFLSLGDTRVETFYWAQMYKAGSGTRGSVGSPSYGVYDHHGPWFAPSPTTCCILFVSSQATARFQFFRKSNPFKVNFAVFFTEEPETHSIFYYDVRTAFRQFFNRSGFVWIRYW